MIQNKHIIKSLPLLAAALGKKYGVEVVIGGDSAYSKACTNGRTIYLPALPLDCDATLLGLARGYIDHESAHLRETDFNILKTGQLTALEKHIWNILEDWRVEQKLAAVFPGCKQNLIWLIKKLFLDAPENEEEQTENGKQDKQSEQETIPDAIRILDWLLFTVRSWDVVELNPKCAELAVRIEADYPNLLDELNQILQTVPIRCHSSQDCLLIAREIVLALCQYVEQWKRAKQAEQEKSFQASNSANSNQNQTFQNKPTNPLRQLEKLTNFLTDALPQDIGSIVVQKLGKGLEAQRDGVVVATLGHKNLGFLSERARTQAKSTTNALRARLQALLQSSQLVRERNANRGKLDTRKLHRISTGDAKIFLARSIRQGLNTAIHILLDSSGSMHGQKMDLACTACYSVAQSLYLVPGVSLAVTAFPGDPDSSIHCNGGDNSYCTVGPILEHGQKLHCQFMLSARGSTPMDAAIWWVLQQMLFLAQSRKIILIISDGEPDNFTATQKAIQAAQENGHEVYGIGIEDTGLQRLLPENSKIIRSIHELPGAMFGVLQGVLLGTSKGV